MGSVSEYRQPGLSHREFIEREVLCGERYSVLDTATVGSTVYAAVADHREDAVFGLVMLIGWSPRGRFNFWHKEITETMGPAEDGCPSRILELLTPTDDECAVEWRRRCRENAARREARPRLRRGQRIRFGESCADAVAGRVFEVLDGRRGLFRGEDGRTHRLRGARKADYEAA